MDGAVREAESRGAGEILLTSIDRDGTKVGFDCELTCAVSRGMGFTLSIAICEPRKLP